MTAGFVPGKSVKQRAESNRQVGISYHASVIAGNASAKALRTGARRSWLKRGSMATKTEVTAS